MPRSSFMMINALLLMVAPTKVDRQLCARRVRSPLPRSTQDSWEGHAESDISYDMELAAQQKQQQPIAKRRPTLRMKGP